MKQIVTTSILFLTSLSACATGPALDQVHSVRERQLTLGLVQRDIRKGQTASEVASILGSPNIVSRDDGQRETWIYDKVSTEQSYSNNTQSIGGIVGAGAVAGTVPILGGIGGSAQQAQGLSATTQKTLTVVIRFDGSSHVDVVDYHVSSF